MMSRATIPRRAVVQTIVLAWLLLACNAQGAEAAGMSGETLLSYMAIAIVVGSLFFG